MSYRDLEEIMQSKASGSRPCHLEPMGGALCRACRRGRATTQAADRRILANEWGLHQGERTVGYLYRAIDKFAETLDFTLSRRRNKPAAI